MGSFLSSWMWCSFPSLRKSRSIFCWSQFKRFFFHHTSFLSVKLRLQFRLFLRLDDSSGAHLNGELLSLCRVSFSCVKRSSSKQRFARSIQHGWRSNDPWPGSSAPASSSPTATWTSRSLQPAWTPPRPPSPWPTAAAAAVVTPWKSVSSCARQLQWFGIEAINSSSLTEAHYWCKPALIILGLSLPWPTSSTEGCWTLWWETDSWKRVRPIICHNRYLQYQAFSP